MRQPASVRQPRAVARILFVLSALLGVGAIALAVVEGVVDGALFALIFVAPALAVGRLLREGTHPAVTRSSALVLAALFLLIVAGNWSGYDARARLLIPLLCGPIALAYLAAFLVAGPQRDRSDTRRRPSAP